MSNPNLKLPTHEWVFVTPEIAELWLGKNEKNRPKKAEQLAKLVCDQQEDRWLVTGETIKFDWDGRLIDGQHRLTAHVKTGTSGWHLVVRGLDPQVQSVIDANANRNARDALFFNDVEGNRPVIAAVAKIDLSRRAGKLQTAADTNTLSVTNQQVVDWYIENKDVERAADKINKIHRHIGSSPSALAYCYMVLSRIDGEAADEFFDAAAEQRTRGLGDPRLTMLRTFARDREQKGGAASNATQIFYIFRAWNAWRQGQELNKLATHRGGVPAVIPEVI